MPLLINRNEHNADLICKTNQVLFFNTINMHSYKHIRGFKFTFKVAVKFYEVHRPILLSYMPYYF
jgi:hypothetical protein